MAEYYAIITDAGEVLLAEAIASGVPVVLTQFAVGDGNGQPVTPDPAMTALTNETYRNTISSLLAEAGSFADQLLGGEAQKVVSFMAALGMSFEDLTAAGKKYNLVTEEGARQAAKGQYALNSLWGVVSSGLKEFTGRILGTASGDVLGIADGLKSTLEAKIPEITKAVTDWFAPDEEDKTGPERLRATVTEIGDTMVKFGLVMANIVDYLSFLLPETRRPEQMDSPAEARQRAKEMAGKKADAKDFGWDLVGRAAFIEEQVLEGEAAWFRAQNRLNDIGMGDIDMSGIRIPSRESSIQQNNEVNINVTTAPGQSAEEIGKAIKYELEYQTPFPATFSPAYD